MKGPEGQNRSQFAWDGCGLLAIPGKHPFEHRHYIYRLTFMIYVCIIFYQICSNKTLQNTAFCSTCICTYYKTGVVKALFFKGEKLPKGKLARAQTSRHEQNALRSNIPKALHICLLTPRCSQATETQQHKRSRSNSMSPGTTKIA